MAVRDWFSRRTALQLALKRGLEPAGDLASELEKLREYNLKSRADAETVCEVLALLMGDKTGIGGKGALVALIRLFGCVKSHDCPAWQVLKDRGVPRLVSIVDRFLDGDRLLEVDDLLCLLCRLAESRTPEGTDAVIRAAHRPIKPDDFWWNPIFHVYSEEHPERERLFATLAKAPPKAPLGTRLAGAANSALLDGATFRHPFASGAGVRELEVWLTDSDPDHSGWAYNAAVALAFIDNNDRDRLLAIALAHPQIEVQLEAAWAATKLGREEGIECLQRYCLDINHSDKARRYLVELDRSDAVPPEAEEPSFRAQAEFAQWLAHPNELGSTPDGLRIVDSRELAWPPERERKPFWLIEYRVRDPYGLKPDDVGAGVVGSVTFCLFGYKLNERPPEDAYAIHCAWEMQCQKLISKAEVDEGSTEYDQMLKQWAGDKLEQAKILRVPEMSPELNYPQRLVALARACLRGADGWVVLDGRRSRWYSESELPSDAIEQTMAMLHVGRELLGFHEQPDRRKFLRPTVDRPPHDVIQAYEKLLNQARSDPVQARKLFGSWKPLGSSFDDYVEALVRSRPGTSDGAVIAAYESLLAIAKASDQTVQSDVFSTIGPLERHFGAYVEALVKSGRTRDIPVLVELFRPHWDHPLGYGKFGTAAFKSGHDELAEEWLTRFRDSCEKWYCWAEIGLLAELWCRHRRRDEAELLLIQALRAVLAESHDATGSDRKLYEEWFQNHRAAYLRLFPDRGDAGLAREGILISTVRKRD
jgi:hypothetical protein